MLSRDPYVHFDIPVTDICPFIISQSTINYIGHTFEAVSSHALKPAN